MGNTVGKIQKYALVPSGINIGKPAYEDTIPVDILTTLLENPDVNVLTDVEYADFLVLDDDISALEGDVATLQGDVTTLQNDLLLVTSDLANLTVAVGVIDVTLGQVSADLITAENDISNLQNDVTILQGDVTTLQTDKADDADVVHLAGTETITGLKTIDATTGLALPATTGTTPSAGTNLRLESSDTTILDVGAASELNWIQSTDKADLSVYYELLLNPRGGNVGIGILVIPTAKLQVFSDTPSAWAVEIMNDATGAGNGLYVNIGALSTGFPFRVDINGVEKFSVNNDGDTSVKGDLGVTGDINLIENMGIMQDPALSADGKYSMTSGETGTLGEAVAFGEFTYLKTADSKYWKADASVVATSAGKIRVCVQAGVANDVVKLMKSGKIRADSLFPAGTIGGAVVLSETAGAVVNIASAPTATDTVTRIIGYWNTADELDVDISQNYITHV